MILKPKVISIAAVSGGGKTTITKILKEKIDQSKALFFDDYDFEECPDNLIEWVDNGANYNEWNLAPLVVDLQNLLNQDYQYILLDYPFAYLNKELEGFIDLAIFIDTPLDIAMARRLLRDFKDASLHNVNNDLTFYLNKGRTAYQEMLRSIKPNSDIVIDGSLPPEEIVDQILDQIRNKEL